MKPFYDAKVNREKALFDRPNYPYYIFVPEYSERSAGVRLAHLLCHALNMRGEDAYVMSKTNANFHSKMISEQSMFLHRESGREPIAIYTDTLPGNPLGAKCVARYFMNNPAILSSRPYVMNPNDILFAMGSGLTPPGVSYYPLRAPDTNIHLFNPPTDPLQERSGTAVYLNRYPAKGGTTAEPDAPFVRDKS